MASWRKPRHWPKPPDRLLAFDENDWGADDGIPYLQWRKARRDWCEEHGFCYPSGGPDPRPEGPLGDVIDQLNAERATRREWGES